MVVGRVGRTPEEPSREFEPSGQSIRNWVRQAERDRGARADGLTSAERTELAQLRRENRRLKQERDILSKSRGLVRTRDRHDPPEGAGVSGRGAPFAHHGGEVPPAERFHLTI
jgi:transposase